MFELHVFFQFYEILCVTEAVFALCKAKDSDSLVTYKCILLCSDNTWESFRIISMYQAIGFF